jgi:hypothetical protein
VELERNRIAGRGVLPRLAGDRLSLAEVSQADHFRAVEDGCDRDAGRQEVGYDLVAPAPADRACDLVL